MAVHRFSFAFLSFFVVAFGCDTEDPPSEKTGLSRELPAESLEVEWSSPTDHAKAYAVADFDADGFPDIVVIDQASVLIAEEQSDGGFSSLQRISASPTTAPAVDAVAVDHDRDGCLDVVVLDERGELTTMLGRCDLNSLGKEVIQAARTGDPNDPLPLGSARFGGPALAAVRSRSIELRPNTVFALAPDGHQVRCLRTAGGPIQTSVDLDGEESANSMVAGDFDHDGISDLALSVGDEQQVHIWFGTNPRDACEFTPDSIAVGHAGILRAAERLAGDAAFDLLIERSHGRLDVIAGGRERSTLANGPVARSFLSSGAQSAGRVNFVDLRRDGKLQVLRLGADPDRDDASARLEVASASAEPLQLQLPTIRMTSTDVSAGCSGVAPINDGLQWFLDYAGSLGYPVGLSLPAGHYCLDGPIFVPSLVTLEGAGMRQTVLEQTQPGAASIILDESTDASVKGLHIKMKVASSGSDPFVRGEPPLDPTRLGESPPGCFRNVATDTCRWRAMRGVVLYGTTRARLERLRISGGHTGVHFADNDSYYDPGKGPAWSPDVDGAGHALPDWCSPETGEFASNLFAHVTDVEIVDPSDRGFSVFNAIGSTVTRSIVRGAGRLVITDDGPEHNNQGFGIKAECGPVLDNRFHENLLYGTQGDAVDVAWAFPLLRENEDGTLASFQVYDELYEGLFYENRFTNNAIFDNTGGVEIKSRSPNTVERRSYVEPFQTAPFPGYTTDGCAHICGATPSSGNHCSQRTRAATASDCGVSPADDLRVGCRDPYEDWLMAIGSRLEFSRNLFLDCRADLVKPDGAAAKFTFRNIATLEHACFPPGTQQPPQVARVRENVFDQTGLRDQIDPAKAARCHAAYFAKTANVSLEDNWFGDAADVAEVVFWDWHEMADVLSNRFEGTEDRFAIEKPFDVNEVGTMTGTPADRAALVSGVFNGPQTTGFMCHDSDLDGCPNGCEALLGGDPIDPSDGATISTCASDCINVYGCGLP